MKASYRWLCELAPDLVGTPTDLSHRMASLGFPVESIEELSRGLSGVVVARVLTTRPHPNADRLRICEVDAGGEVLQVVCGASNVRPEGWYPFAAVGTELPGGMTIGEAKIRGERSFGMLCSERELGLGGGHEGLLELEGPFEPGASFVETLGLDDVRLDVEVTSNRPDLLSHEGLARELSTKGGARLPLPAIPDRSGIELSALTRIESSEAQGRVQGDGVTLRIEDPERCGEYLGVVVRGVRVGPSPDWLQRRLRAAGSRPINNVVDATNYVLLELGQPLHAFDLARLRGSEIRVRRARAGEALRTLDGIDRRLSTEMLAICDAEGPVAVAGVMGGENSEVSETTSEILLECAHFTPGPIRATRKELGISTDASYRFERGVDPLGLDRALARCLELILATAGGELAGSLLVSAPRRPERRVIGLRLSRIGHLLGVPMASEEVSGLLEPLGFEVTEQAEGVLQVLVPGYRYFDVTREVDLIEEVARRRGFDHFPAELRPARPSAVPDHPLFALEARIRDRLTGRGLHEAQTPAFAPEGEGVVELQNPLSSEERYLRGRLLPNLLRRVEWNLARGNRDVRLYELGTTFHAPVTAGALPEERSELGLVLHGLRAPGHWESKGGRWDIWEVKGILEELGVLLLDGGGSVEGWEGEAVAGFGFEPGFSLRLLDREGVPVGRGGRISSRVLDLPAWAGEVWGIEVTLPPEPRPHAATRFAPIPAYPGVERDLALLVPDDLPSAQVRRGIEGKGGPFLREVELFDLYRGAELGDGVRSLALRLRFRSSDRTLTDEEVERTVAKILRDLEEELGVRVRGSTSR